MIRRLFRLVFYLLLLAVALVVAGLLLLDTILKAVVENRIRAETGMDAEIGRLNFGLLTPTVTVEDFRLNNSADFGGAPFLVIRELRVEYDREALKRGKLRMPLLRLDVREIDEVIDERGRSNFDELRRKEDESAKRKAARHEAEWAFGGIDHLNLSLGRGRTIHLGHPELNREVSFGIDNQVFSRVNSDDDLDTLMLYLTMRTGGTMYLQGLAGHPAPAKTLPRPPVSKRQ